jgi:hypothetical protein
MSHSTKAPDTPPPAPPPPTLEDPSVTAARQAELRANLLRKGRMSTVSAGNTDLSEGLLNKKTLLGS